VSEIKVCKRCKLEKPTSEFTKNINEKDKYDRYCKLCKKELNKEHRKKNELSIKNGKIIVPNFKVCNKCKIEKQIYEFHNNSGSRDGKQSICIQCCHDLNISENGRNYHHLYNTSKEQVEKNKIRNSTPEAREYQRIYNKSDSHKESRKRYNASTNGKLVSKKLNATPGYKQRRKEYEKTPNGKIAASKKDHKRRSLSESVPATLTLEEWSEILKIQKNRCAICGKEFGEDLKPTKDHIIPVIMKGHLSMDNVQATCKSCNSSKSDKAYTGLIRLGMK